MSQTSYPSVSPPASGKGKAARPAAAGSGKTPESVPAPATAQIKVSLSSETIAKRAYEKYLARGGAHGSDQEDWAEAERELRAESHGG